MALPVGRGYVEAQLGVAQAHGVYAQVEAGYRLLDPLAVFGFGRWVPHGESMAGVGARVVF